MAPSHKPSTASSESDRSSPPLSSVSTHQSTTFSRIHKFTAINSPVIDDHSSSELSSAPSCSPDPWGYDAGAPGPSTRATKAATKACNARRRLRINMTQRAERVFANRDHAHFLQQCGAWEHMPHTHPSCATFEDHVRYLVRRHMREHWRLRECCHPKLNGHDYRYKRCSYPRAALRVRVSEIVPDYRHVGRVVTVASGEARRLLVRDGGGGADVPCASIE